MNIKNYVNNVYTCFELIDDRNASYNNLDALTTVFTEFYYWITLPLMFLIHVQKKVLIKSFQILKNMMD